jgi:hypothetical protein
MRHHDEKIIAARRAFAEKAVAILGAMLEQVAHIPSHYSIVEHGGKWYDPSDERLDTWHNAIEKLRVREAFLIEEYDKTILQVYLPSVSRAEKLYEEYRRQCDGSSKADTKPKPKDISYNKVTGIGYAHGKRFQFKSHQPEYKVFPVLYDNINKALEPDQIIKLMEYDGEQPNDEISKLIKSLRKKTGLNNDAIAVNNRALTLVGSDEEDQ